MNDSTNPENPKLSDAASDTVVLSESVAVPVAFIQNREIRPAIKMLYLHLLSLAPDLSPIPLLLGELAAETGHSRNRVVWMLDELKRFGLLVDTRRGTTQGRMFQLRAWDDVNANTPPSPAVRQKREGKSVCAA